MKLKYKDIDWYVMWEVFPEAEAFACDLDENLMWFYSVPELNDFEYTIDEHSGILIGLYDLEDIDWRDTLKVRPKIDKFGEFKERLLAKSMESMTLPHTDPVTAAIISAKAIRIAKEVFGDE